MKYLNPINGGAGGLGDITYTVLASIVALPEQSLLVGLVLLDMLALPTSPAVLSVQTATDCN